jgi:hypothetical protein
MRLAVNSAPVAVKCRAMNQSTVLESSLYNEMTKIKVPRKMVGQSGDAMRKFVIYTAHLMFKQALG